MRKAAKCRWFSCQDVHEFTDELSYLFSLQEFEVSNVQPDTLQDLDAERSGVSILSIAVAEAVLDSETLRLTLFVGFIFGFSNSFIWSMASKWRLTERSSSTPHVSSI